LNYIYLGGLNEYKRMGAASKIIAVGTIEGHQAIPGGRKGNARTPQEKEYV
jgi:hypothetical protein